MGGGFAVKVMWPGNTDLRHAEAVDSVGVVKCTLHQRQLSTHSRGDTMIALSGSSRKYTSSLKWGFKPPSHRAVQRELPLCQASAQRRKGCAWSWTRQGARTP